MKSQRSFHSIHSQGDDKSRVQLPRISNETRNSVTDEYCENPFYVPADEEIFKMKAKEKELKEEERRRVHGLKIWEKGIKNSSEGKLRKIMELTHQEDDDNQDENDGKLNIVEAAKSAIKNRVRHKEPLLNFLNKKREMFLFQMSINEKKEQIKEFEELAHLQEISLQNSKDLLEKDAETFKQHVEKNKNETRQAIKNAEDETKEKQKKIQEMKQLQEDLSTLMSKNTKQLEKLEKLYAYKVFLDKLTPEEFLRNQKRERDQRRLEKTLLLNPGLGKGQNKEEFKWHIYNINLSSGILELLNDDDDQSEMFFRNSDQLQELFDNLEEKNLFIIKYTQDIEQSLEDLKHNFEIKKTELLDKERQLKKNKQDLEKAKQARNKTIKQLCEVRNDKFTERTLSRLEIVLMEIYKKSDILKEGRSEQQNSGFDILRRMESILDYQLKELKDLPSQDVWKMYNDRVKKSKEAVNKEKLEQERKDKHDKAEEKKRKQTHKRLGRPIMAKSMPPQEDEEEAEVGTVDEEEIIRKLYFTTRFQ